MRLVSSRRRLTPQRSAGSTKRRAWLVMCVCPKRCMTRRHPACATADTSWSASIRSSRLCAGHETSQCPTPAGATSATPPARRRHHLQLHPMNLAARHRQLPGTRGPSLRQVNQRRAAHLRSARRRRPRDDRQHPHGMVIGSHELALPYRDLPDQLYATHAGMRRMRYFKKSS